MIKQGVDIGTGAVIGMGSIVTKDVETYSIVAGNPAKILRPRFHHSISEGLLKSKWWEFNDNKLREYARHIKNPEIFLQEIEN